MRRGSPIEITRPARVLAGMLLMLAALCWNSVTESSAAGAIDLGLLEVSALRGNLDAWVILDARPRAAFAEGHIPGARSFSWEDFTRTDDRGVPFRIWSPGELASALATKGIDERSQVVVYGDADKSWGGEGWACWALEWIGHQGPVRLLAGGIQAWRDQGNALVNGAEVPPVQPATYQTNPRSEIDIEISDLRKGLGTQNLVDVRSTKEWLGGHIPGAVHIDWDKFFIGADRRPIPPDKVRALLASKGIDLDRPVVYYCAGGIRSAYAWLGHQLAGLPAARNYEGGMEEWKRTKR
jgi:thiosulfate/3-mercaptopyruvate sulfurtransferase